MIQLRRKREEISFLGKVWEFLRASFLSKEKILGIAVKSAVSIFTVLLLILNIVYLSPIVQGLRDSLLQFELRGRLKIYSTVRSYANIPSTKEIIGRMLLGCIGKIEMKIDSTAKSPFHGPFKAAILEASVVYAADDSLQKNPALKIECLHYNVFPMRTYVEVICIPGSPRPYDFVFLSYQEADTSKFTDEQRQWLELLVKEAKLKMFMSLQGANSMQKKNTKKNIRNRGFNFGFAFPTKNRWLSKDKTAYVNVRALLYTK